MKFRFSLAFLGVLILHLTDPVFTSDSPSRMVASPPAKDEELSPASSQHQDDKGSIEGDATHPMKVTASEVGDMLKDPYHNSTSNSDREEEPVVDSDTYEVDDPHVIHDNKTHEEDHKPEPTKDISQVTIIDDPHVTHDNKTHEEDHKPEPTKDISQVTIIDDPHVTHDNKTHEEDHKTEPATGENKSNPASSATSVRDDDHDSAASTEATSPGNNINWTSTKEENILTMLKTDVQTPSTLTVSSESGNTPNDGHKLDEGEVSALISHHESRDHLVVGKAPLDHTTQAAAILAGVLVLVALAGYVGLLSWRRILEKRYGNREMLVNEEDDFRHFEL